jgi:HD-GYP domain-containing protein (c-di-GMP phosphodiesterase class II)
VYLPLEPEFLVSSRSLPFDIYRRAEGNQLRRVFAEGDQVPGELRDEIRSESETSLLYVRRDRLKALLSFQEEQISEILQDEKVTTDFKCRALRGLTTSLACQLLDSPSAINIQSQRENVGRMVDFTLREPLALRSLLQLTHHDYSTYTHSVNVGFYGLGIGTQQFRNGNGSDDNLHEIAVGFFLHDIGKC